MINHTPSHAKRRVLVVDDNIDAAETLAMLVESLGEEALVAHDGEEALAQASSGAPDVIFLDIGLPRLDGYEVCRRLRKSGKTDVFVVALTGYGQAEDRQRTSDAGFDAHLVKPASLEAIKSVLAGSAERAGMS